MQNNALSIALRAADILLATLRTSSSDELNDTELEMRIRQICDLKQKRLRKRPPPAKRLIRERRIPIENFIMNLGDVQRKKFINAAQAAENATWSIGAPLFAGFTFPQASSGLATLLGWYRARSTDATRETRVLTVIMEAYVHEEAEVQGVDVNNIHDAMAKETGWTRRKIQDLCKCGRWHMSILESEDLGLGALAILGDKNDAAGNGLSQKAESVANFVRCCLEIDGFQAKSHGLSAYVYDGLQLCINQLQIGQSALALSPDNRLRQILSRHEQSRVSRSESEPSDNSRQPRVTIEANIRRSNTTNEEQNHSVVATNSSFHVSTCLGQAVDRMYSDLGTHFNPLLVRTPSLCMDQHTLPYQSPVFQEVYNGDFKAIAVSINQGSVPVNAVDPYGLGLGYYALYYCWRCKGAATALSMFAQLLSYKLEREWPDEIGSKPVETLLDSYFMSVSKGECSRDVWDIRLKEVISWFGEDWETTFSRYLQKRSFNHLHRKLLAVDPSDHDDLESFLRSVEQDGRLSSLINGADAQGRTPLTWAVEYHHELAAKLLIEYGANVDYKRDTRNGRMPLLHLLCAAPQVPQELLVLLLQAGANVNSQDEEGWTVAHIAASWLDTMTIKTLRNYAKELDLSIMNQDGVTAGRLAQELGGNQELLSLLI